MGYNTAMAVVELNSELEPTKDNQYLVLAGEISGVFSEKFGENWPRYKGTTLYLCMAIQLHLIWHSSAIIHHPAESSMLIVLIINHRSVVTTEHQ